MISGKEAQISLHPDYIHYLPGITDSTNREDFTSATSVASTSESSSTDKRNDKNDGGDENYEVGEHYILTFNDDSTDQIPRTGHSENNSIFDCSDELRNKFLYLESDDESRVAKLLSKVES